ncbi:MAG: hypothetical protein ACK2U3_09415 [Anaerolineales bacterium]
MHSRVAQGKLNVRIVVGQVREVPRDAVEQGGQFCRLVDLDGEQG